MEEDGALYIRANQAHSLDCVEDAALLGHPLASPPLQLYHATDLSHDIMSSGGVKRMGRNHIHFGLMGTPHVPIDKKAILVCDTAKCMEMGIEFFLSSNGVYLSRGDETGTIPMDCLSVLVTTTKGGVEE